MSQVPLDPLRPGALVGDHQLGHKLGEGAMGWVFEAEHTLIGKRVAIKVMKGTGQEGRLAAKRLLEEARSVNAIRHRGIIDIFDAGVLADGRPYLVMELLEGRSLHDEVKRSRGGLSVRVVFHLLAGVLEPLMAAHRAGVIHRDLKASNVFLLNAPQGLPLVKLLDFGIARRKGREEVLTSPQMTVGSMGFMGPEHIAGKVVPQSDLYGVGCLAWLMLTGRPVFPYGNPMELLQNHVHVKPPSVRTLRAETPPELEAWVAWLLEKKVEARPFSAEVALTVLREAEAASEGVRTAPGGPSFIELARGLDERARQVSGARAAVTDVTPAYVPPAVEEEPSSEVTQPPATPPTRTRPKSGTATPAIRKPVETVTSESSPSLRRSRVVTAGPRAESSSRLPAVGSNRPPASSPSPKPSRLDQTLAASLSDDGEGTSVGLEAPGPGKPPRE